MSTNSELAAAPVAPGFHRATTALSETLGVEPRMMIDTLKKQCFPGMAADAISDAQLAAFISVANTLKLNPLIPGMLFAYPSRNGGIVPVSGPDGVLMKLDELIGTKLDGYECTVFPEDVTQAPTHAIAKIWRKGSDKPAVFTAIFKEWAVGNNPNWGARPRHMLWLRAIKQCARQVIHGVPYDRDDVELGDMVNVTPEATPTTPPPERAPVPEKKSKAPKGAQTVTAAHPTPAPAVEVQATPVAETATPPAPEPKPAPAAEAKPEPAKTEPKVEAPKTEAASSPKAPRTKLEDGEIITVTATIKTAAGILINFQNAPTPSVSATIASPEYEGTVYHIGGGERKGEAIVPSGAWTGASAKITLRGKKNKIGGNMMTVVDAIVADAEAVSVE